MLSRLELGSGLLHKQPVKKLEYARPLQPSSRVYKADEVDHRVFKYSRNCKRWIFDVSGPDHLQR